MRIVIVGYGRVGSRTARVLAEEGHAVVIVETDVNAANRARENGFTVVDGDGATEGTLEQADIASADALGGLTSDLNVNFSACMIANQYDCRTVLRIDEDYREEIYETYADDVDEVIYPERLGAAGAKTALLGGDFNVIADLTEQLQISVVKVPEHSSVIGKRVPELDLPASGRVYAHGHKGDNRGR